MRTIIVLGLVAGLLTASPALAGTAATDGFCGPDGPEAYNRPGGYCDILRANESISETGSGQVGGPTGSAPEATPSWSDGTEPT